MPRKTSSHKQQHAPVVVVAGGAGFLGSHLSEALLKAGATVLALDDLVTGRMANIAEIRRHPHFEFFECNINQSIPAALFERPITHIIHAASFEAHTGGEVTLASLLTGAFGTKNLLDLSVGTGATFLLVSTLSVYEGLASSTSLHYYFGSTDSQEAQYSQNESKRYAEALCELYAKEYNLDARVARVSQLYGPRMDLRGGSVLGELIQATVTGKDLSLKADSSQEMILTYISDAVYGLCRLAFAQGDQYRQTIYQLANLEKVSLLSVAYTLREFLPSGKEVLLSDRGAMGAMPLPKISVDRSKKDLDWEPVVGLTAGLRDTIQWFQAQKDLPETYSVSKAQLATQVPLPTPTASAATTPKPTVTVTPELASTSPIQRPVADVVIPPTVPAPVATATPGTVVAGGQVSGLKFRAGAAGIPATPEPMPPVPATGERVATTANSPQLGTDQASVARGATTKPEPAKGSVKIKPTHWWKRLLFGAVAATLYLGMGRPLLQTTAYAAAGGMSLRAGLSEARGLSMGRAQQDFLAARANLASARAASHQLSCLAGALHQSASLSQFDQGLAASVATSDGLATLSGAAQPWVDEAHRLAQFRHADKNSPDLTNLAKQTATSIQQAQQSFGQAMVALSGPGQTRVAGAEWQNGQGQVGEGIFSGLLAQASQVLASGQAVLSQVQPAVTAMPGVLGADGQKTYLVMLQNSNELRPTGGFMGSYAKIVVEGGKITHFDVDDIYNPDGQLHTSMPSAPPLFQVFGATTQTLRDANWSPDATESAQTISQLYAQATGVKPDGVVFVTTGAIKPLLEAVGPVYLSGFHETVDSQNFAMLGQIHSDVGYKPGSSGKKDFLGQLTEAMINRLEQGDQSLWGPLGKAVMTGLGQRDIQIALTDPSVQALIDTQDWSGRMKATAGDYLRVVDANLSANKANYYMTRKTDYSINVNRESKLYGVAKVTWQHSGTSGTWPGGDYLNYVRIYVPQGSKLTQASGFVGNKVDTAEVDGKTVFGGYVKVPYHSTESVEVRYDLPETLGLLSQGGAYQLFWQKQAGIPAEPLTVSFNLPPFLQAVSVGNGGELRHDGVTWQQTGTMDQVMKLQVSDRQ